MKLEATPFDDNALQRLPQTIRELDISHTNVTEEGLIAFLKTHRKITRLTVNALPITGATFEALVDLKIKLKYFSHRIYDKDSPRLVHAVSGFVRRGEDYLAEVLREDPNAKSKEPELWNTFALYQAPDPLVTHKNIAILAQVKTLKKVDFSGHFAFDNQCGQTFKRSIKVMARDTSVTMEINDYKLHTNVVYGYLHS